MNHPTNIADKIGKLSEIDTSEQGLSNLSPLEQFEWLVRAELQQQRSTSRMEQEIEALTAQIAYLTERLAEIRYTLVDEIREERELI